MKIFLFTFLLSISVYARIEVAFIEVRNYHGEVVQLEPDGQFAHIAISYKNGWLHAHPIRGVELVDRTEIEKMGLIKKIILISEQNNLNKKNVNRFLGKPYDSDFSWSDNKIYCSELVAKLLNLKPTPMTFDSEIWLDKQSTTRDKLGLSPDDIYKELVQRESKSQVSKSCDNLF